MSVALMTAVWGLDLPATDKMVLLALADAANDEGVTWLAVKSRRAGKADLTTKCSLSERAVQGSIKRLCEGGYLARDEKPGKGVIYTLTPAAGAARSKCAPADNDTDPRISCGETLSNPNIPSEAKASSGTRPRKAASKTPDQTAVDTIWRLQPDLGGRRRSTRPDIRDALASAVRRGGSEGEVIEALRRYYATPDSRKDGGQYAAGAAVMLHKDRWRDFLPEPKPPPEVATPEVAAQRLRHYRDTREWRPEWGERPRSAA